MAGQDDLPVELVLARSELTAADENPRGSPMAFEDELQKKLGEIFGAKWEVRDGKVVPEPEDIKLGKDAVRLDGTVLYADLADSTSMVLGKKPEFAAEVYKAYLDIACRVIRHNGGVITAFDGDRVMAVFIGDSKNTSAVRSALNINWAVTVVNEEMKKKWDTDFVVRQSVGVDTSSLWVAKTGIRGSNDLVWVGRSANFAAKLCSLRDGIYVSWITADVYNSMADDVKYAEKYDGKVNMWESQTWYAQNTTVYRSSWQWKIG